MSPIPNNFPIREVCDAIRRLLSDYRATFRAIRNGKISCEDAIISLTKKSREAEIILSQLRGIREQQLENERSGKGEKNKNGTVSNMQGE